MPRMRAGKCIAEYLENEGVKYFFGIPGGGIAVLFNELYDYPQIKTILTKHEQGAGFMADGYHRVSGVVAACGGTIGPGGMNLSTGLHPAYQDNQPVLAFTTNLATTLFGKGGIQDASGWGPRTISHIDQFRGVTKWSVLVTKAEVIPEVMRRAFRIMLTERKGPVHIDLAYDVVRQEIDTEIWPPETYKPTGRIRGDKALTRRAAELLLNAQNPAILSGGGVIASGSSPELLELAELLSIPVATTAMGKSSFPEDHPLSLGVAGAWGHETANAVLRKEVTDVLLAIGCVFHQVTTHNWARDFGGDKIIHVDIDAKEIGKNYLVDIGIVGDAKAFLQDILIEVKALLSKRKDLREIQERKSERVKEVLKLKNELKYFSEPEMFSDVVPLKPQRVIKEIKEFLNKDGIVLADCGNNLAWVERYFQTHFPKGFIADGGHTTMGFSVAASIGAKLGAPNKQVLDVCGNASFTMLCKEVNTASSYDIPVVWCILNDMNLGMIKQGQKWGYGSWKPGRYIATEAYVMDFVKFAEACHAIGLLVERPGEIKDCLKTAFVSGKPTVIDIRIDPDEFPPGSLKRLEARSGYVTKYPELLTKKMPVQTWPKPVL